MFRRGNPVCLGRFKYAACGSPHDRWSFAMTSGAWPFAMTMGALAGRHDEKKRMAGRDHNRPWPMLCVSRADDL